MENNINELNALHGNLNALAVNMNSFLSSLRGKLSPEELATLDEELKKVNVPDVMKEVASANEQIAKLRNQL